MFENFSSLDHTSQKKKKKKKKSVICPPTFGASHLQWIYAIYYVLFIKSSNC